MQRVFKKITDELNKFIDSRDARINTNQNYNGSGGFSKAIEIVNQVASEYSEEVCERKWGIDYAQVQCEGDKIIFGSRRLFSYCPYCGKKIKEIE